MYEKMLEITKWWVGHLTFTILLNLIAFGSYHVWVWYQITQPIMIDVSRLDNEGLNDLSKEIFREQVSRK